MTAPVGPLAAEAAQLLDALAERLTAIRDRRPDGDGQSAGDPPQDPAQPDPAAEPPAARPLADGSAGARDQPDRITGTAGAATDSDAAGGPDDGRCPRCGHDPAANAACTACPLCRLTALLRGERPESTARLVDGALTVIQLLRGLLPASPDPASPDPASPASPDPASPDPASPDPASPQQSPSPRQPASTDPASSQDVPSPGNPEGSGLVRIDIR